MEGWLLGRDISPSLSSSYFPPLLFRNVFLQNGTRQWGVLPHASCYKIHLDFHLLNQYIPPMVLEPPSLQTTTAETHQFQPAPGLWTAEATPVPALPCVQWAGRWDAEGRGQLWFVAMTAVQDKGSKLGKDRAAGSRSTLGGWCRLFHSHPLKPGKGEKLFVLLYSPVLVCKDIYLAFFMLALPSEADKGTKAVHFGLIYTRKMTFCRQNVSALLQLSWCCTHGHRPATFSIISPASYWCLLSAADDLSG